MLKDKVALVTGAASGIGRCVALTWAREGARVVLADLNEDSDYYVGYAGSRISGATLADWGASENNADAKMRDGFVFDDATGLIYVPKKYTEKNKKGELKVASSRIQLLYATADKGAENSISVKISDYVVDSSAGSFDRTLGFIFGVGLTSPRREPGMERLRELAARIRVG